MRPPRFKWHPPRASSLGPAAVEFAARSGIILDGHQAEILDTFMGRRADGGWASLQNGVCEPRQNGKSLACIVRLLYGAFEMGERHVVYSAHMWASSFEAFLVTQGIIDACPELSGRVKHTRRSAADLGFVLVGGERIRFLTRSRGTARGFSGELVVLDEAHFLGEATHAALLPSLAARSSGGNVQIIYASSAADQSRHPDAEVMASVRRRGIAGGSDTVAYLEWSAEALDADGNPLPPDLVPDEVAGDPAVWLATNPGMPDRISLEYVAGEFEALDRRSFSNERLGIGDWPTGDLDGSGLISVEAWMDMCDPASTIADDSPLCIAFDVGPGLKASVAIAGRRPDKLVHFEVTDCQQGTTGLVERLVELVNRHDPETVVVDAYGQAGNIAARIEDEGVNVKRVTPAEHGQAVAAMLEAVAEVTRRHLGSAELVEAVKGATTRDVGDARLFSRRNSRVDISPLVAASLAAWAADATADSVPDFHVW